jgi:hypothetical protein
MAVALLITGFTRPGKNHPPGFGKLERIMRSWRVRRFKIGDTLAKPAKVGGFCALASLAPLAGGKPEGFGCGYAAL